MNISLNKDVSCWITNIYSHIESTHFLPVMKHNLHVLVMKLILF